MAWTIAGWSTAQQDAWEESARRYKDEDSHWLQGEARGRAFPGSEAEVAWQPASSARDVPMEQEEEAWDEEEYMREQQELLERQAAFERQAALRAQAKGAGKRAPVGPYAGKPAGKPGPQLENTSISYMVNSI